VTRRTRNRRKVKRQPKPTDRKVQITLPIGLYGLITEDAKKNERTVPSQIKNLLIDAYLGLAIKSLEKVVKSAGRKRR